MKIQVKIKPKEEYNEENLDWSEPVDIDEFILDPYEVEFEWEDGSQLPYKDFLFFGNEYYYKIFINLLKIILQKRNRYDIITIGRGSL